MLFSNKKGLTILELIVVVTIFSILMTLSFLAYSGYASSSRDASRISSLTEIGDGMSTMAVRSELPDPTEYIEIKAGSKTIALQGYLSEVPLSKIGYMGEGTDPLDYSYYTYYLHSNKKVFQLMGFLEAPLDIATSFNIVKDTFASIDYTQRYPFFYGKKLGLLTGTGNAPIQTISSIVLSGSIDVFDLDIELITHLDQDNKATGTGEVIHGVNTLYELTGKFCEVEGNKISCDSDDSFCTPRPNYPNAVFTPGKSTQNNIVWQNTDFRSACYYECKTGFGGIDCNL